MDPLPVDGGADFRDLSEAGQRAAQYALSIKILRAIERQELSDEQKAAIANALTSAKTKLDRSQARIKQAIQK